MEVYIHSLLTLEPDRGGGRFTPRKEPEIPTEQQAG
jgi:hypothetical protein